MIKPNVAQSISAVACAIIAATLVAPLPAVPVAKAETAVTSPDAKGDRLVLRTQGTACSDLGWPHYEQHCIFDRSRPADELRTVRVINLR